MSLLIFIGGLVIGIIGTLFVNGVFPLKDTLEEIWRSKQIALTVLLGLFAIVGVIQGWSMVAMGCALGLCGLVLYSKVYSKDEAAKRLKEMQFWIEVRLKEMELLIEEKFAEAPNKDSMQDMVKQIIKEKSDDILEFTDEDFRNAKAEGGKIYIDKNRKKK